MIFLYVLDSIIMPTVLTMADSEMKSKAIQIVNNAILDEYSKNFQYDKIINFQKDKDGNIVVMKADTLKMNKIACDVALEAQENLKKLGCIGVKIPAGYITKNNILAYFGPDITVKMEPVGNIETKYLSTFESAGINQTNHKIYVQVTTNIKVILPFISDNIKIKNEVPISETIIVGKVPKTAIQMDLDSAGIKLKN